MQPIQRLKRWLEKHRQHPPKSGGNAEDDQHEGHTDAAQAGSSSKPQPGCCTRHSSDVPETPFTSVAVLITQISDAASAVESLPIAHVGAPLVGNCPFPPCQPRLSLHACTAPALWLPLRLSSRPPCPPSSHPQCPSLVPPPTPERPSPLPHEHAHNPHRSASSCLPSSQDFMYTSGQWGGGCFQGHAHALYAFSSV